jgi:hypothetical protein
MGAHATADATAHAMGQAMPFLPTAALPVPFSAAAISLDAD